MDEFDPIWALGCMSGTSLDGVDVASILTDGVSISNFGANRFHKYSEEVSTRIAEGFGRWPGDRPLLLNNIAKLVLDEHVAALRAMPEPGIIGFHGQTLSHDPANGRSFQIGDGAELAALTGTQVAWDFRSQDMKEGGQGAPLAPFFHFACAKWAGITAPVAFLNLGGVGNITYVDPSFDAPEDPGAVLAFDTGPANAPINDFLNARLSLPFDEDGKIAREGFVDEDLINRILTHDYFFRSPPKSLDRNDFSSHLQPVAALGDADAVATLTALPAACVAQGIKYLPQTPSAIFVCGGGAKNPVIMEELATRTDIDIKPVEDIGLNGDMLEAQAFGYLAVRVLRGLPLSAPLTTGCVLPAIGGQISQPPA